MLARAHMQDDLRAHASVEQHSTLQCGSRDSMRPAGRAEDERMRISTSLARYDVTQSLVVTYVSCSVPQAKWRQ
jgi:hypothetical protein